MMITKIALDLAEKDSWFKSIMSKTKPTVYVDAINFRDEAYVLAGPFCEKYAYAEITDHSQDKDLKSEKELENFIRKDTRDTLIFWPYKYQQKIKDAFGTGCDYWYSEEKGDSISQFDIETGTHPQSYKKTGSKCSLFATSEKGIKKLFSPLSEDEYQDGLKQLESKIERYITDALETCPTKEKPFKVYVCGNDDASWSKTFATLDECKLLIMDLHDYGASAMSEQMTFTN